MNNLVDDSPAPKSQDFDIDRPRRNPDMSKRILINSYRIFHRDSMDLNSKDLSIEKMAKYAFHLLSETRFRRKLVLTCFVSRSLENCILVVSSAKLRWIVGAEAVSRGQQQQ